jgi:hypothetical protein
VRCSIALAGRPFAVAVVSYSWASPAGWARLRRAATTGPVDGPPRVDAAVVGRGNPYNVVIAQPRDGRARLVVATDHPVLFDHELDHVPGMLQLEAVRQFATAITGAGPVLALTARFHDFLELGLPSHCAGTVVDTGPGGVTVHCRLTQRDKVAGEVTVRLAIPVSRPAPERTLTAVAG